MRLSSPSISPVRANPYRNILVDQNMAKIKYLACLGSSMYQRTVDELQDELNSFEHRLSTSATTAFYKRKIYDLEAICCADLNRVKSRFVRSLQAFENTIDSIEEPRSQRISAEGCRCSKNHLTGYNVDAYRHERPATRNAKHGRSLPRSKYVRTRTLLRGENSFTLAAINRIIFHVTRNGLLALCYRGRRVISYRFIF